MQKYTMLEKNEMTGVIFFESAGFFIYRPGHAHPDTDTGIPAGNTIRN